MPLFRVIFVPHSVRSYRNLSFQNGPQLRTLLPSWPGLNKSVEGEIKDLEGNLRAVPASKETSRSIPIEAFHLHEGGLENRSKRATMESY